MSSWLKAKTLFGDTPSWTKDMTGTVEYQRNSRASTEEAA
jgi:hypothetical protein